MCLKSIPKELLLQLNKLTGKLKPLVFNLSALHVAILKLNCGTSRLPCTFHQLLSCMTTLLSLSANVVVSIATVAREVYADCCESDIELERLVTVCLSPESLVGGASLLLNEGVELTVPHQGVDPARYLDHVTIDSSESSLLLRYVRIILL